MFRLTHLFILLSVLCLPGLLYGGTVTFVAGSVSIQDGGKQSPAKAGDKFSSAAKLVSQKKGLLRVKQSNAQITLKFPGTYSVANLLKAAKASSKGSSLVSDALKSHASQPVPGIVAGIRASDPAQQIGVFSMGGMISEVSAEQIQQWLTKGDYVTIESSVTSPIDGYESYALGFSLYQLKKNNRAKPLLKRAMREAAVGQIRARAATTLAAIYFEEGDHKMALAVADKFQKTHSISESPAELYFIQSVSAELLGKESITKESKASLKKLYPKHRLTKASE